MPTEGAQTQRTPSMKTYNIMRMKPEVMEIGVKEAIIHISNRKSA